MRTVKEVSGLTGISVRTLHYYDKIGLLSPTQHSESGYRLYDDKALETLQQILFFREFGIPLKEIFISKTEKNIVVVFVLCEREIDKAVLITVRYKT